MAGTQENQGELIHGGWVVVAIFHTESYNKILQILYSIATSFSVDILFEKDNVTVRRNFLVFLS